MLSEHAKSCPPVSCAATDRIRTTQGRQEAMNRTLLLTFLTLSIASILTACSDAAPAKKAKNSAGDGRRTSLLQTSAVQPSAIFDQEKLNNLTNVDLAWGGLVYDKFWVTNPDGTLPAPPATSWTTTCALASVARYAPSCRRGTYPMSSIRSSPSPRRCRARSWKCRSSVCSWANLPSGSRREDRWSTRRRWTQSSNGQPDGGRRQRDRRNTCALRHRLRVW